MELNQEFQCEIEKCVFGGDGMTHVDGEVIFIPGTLPGEKLIGRVTALKRNFARAEAIRFGEKNPHRIEASCPFFGRCPGCRYRHIDYAYETGLKNNQLSDMLRTAGFELSSLAPPISPEPADGYRNKLVLHVHTVGKKIFFGYVMGDNTTVTDIDYCPLARKELNEKLAELRRNCSFMASLREGMDVTLRYASLSGEVKVWRNLPARNETWLKEKMSFGELSVPCGSFFQVNANGAEALLSEFQSILEKRRPQQVIDLYAGAGLFGCAAAASGIRKVLAVESDPAAAEAARYNLRKFNAEFQVIAGDAAEGVNGFPDRDPAETLLVVDPPRGGLSLKTAMVLTGSHLRDLICISCNPATWLRDAVRLRKGGFTPKRIRMVNMFPRTEHFELFTYWSR